MNKGPAYAKASVDKQGSGLRGVVEALLLITDKPLSLKRLKEITGVEEKIVKKVLEDLREEYEAQERGFILREIAGGYRFYTHPNYAFFVEKLLSSFDQRKITQAALETLAIIAYKQPLTRMEISTIRGVSADAVISSLLAKELIKEVGRKDTPGKPLLYGTTSKFMEAFGLKSLKNLPPLEEFVPDEETKKTIQESFQKIPQKGD